MIWAALAGGVLGFVIGVAVGHEIYEWMERDEAYGIDFGDWDGKND